MRCFLLYLFLVLPLTLLAQANSSDSKLYYSTFFENEIEIEGQNWVEDSLEFLPGNYYRFVGKVKEGKNEHLLLKYPQPMLILGFLFGQNIDVEEAWYRPFTSNCGMLDVIVHGSFLIRVNESDMEDALNNFGFVKVENPTSPGDCPYNVTHYVFKN